MLDTQDVRDQRVLACLPTLAYALLEEPCSQPAANMSKYC
jgi:hypothetical protein